LEIARVHPEYGYRRMNAELRDRGIQVNRKVVARLHTSWDLAVIKRVRKPKTSSLARRLKETVRGSILWRICLQSTILRFCTRILRRSSNGEAGPKAMSIWRRLIPDSKQKIDCCFGNRKTWPRIKKLSLSGFGIIIMSVDTRRFKIGRRFDIPKRRVKHPAEMLAQISPLSGSKNADHNRMLLRRP